MVNFGVLVAQIVSLVWGTPANFNGFRIFFGSITARHSSSGRQRNFAALNRGRHLYSTGRPSCWALAHILVITIIWKFDHMYAESGPGLSCSLCAIMHHPLVVGYVISNRRQLHYHFSSDWPSSIFMLCGKRRTPAMLLCA